MFTGSYQSHLMIKKRHHRILFFGIILPIALYFAGLIHFANKVKIFSKRSHTAFTQLPKQNINSEAIVVLTGDRRRIPKALELLRLRPSPLLIISGAGTMSLKEVVNQQGDSAVNIHEVWKKIRLESLSSSTIENAHETERLLRPLNVKRIVLVTSEYHMVRALEIFQKALPQYEYADYPVHSDVSHLLEMKFSGKAFNGLWYLNFEYVKYLLYFFYSSHFLAPNRG